MIHILYIYSYNNFTVGHLNYISEYENLNEGTEIMNHL